MWTVVGTIISLCMALACALVMYNGGKLLEKEVIQWCEYGLYVFGAMSILLICITIFAPRKEKKRARWYPRPQRR